MAEIDATNVTTGATNPASTNPNVERRTANKTDVLSAITDVLQATLKDASANLDEARKNISDFLVQIEPDLETALLMSSTGDPSSINTVKFFYNATILRAQRIGQGLVAAEKDAIAAAIIAVVKGLIAAGITALV